MSDESRQNERNFPPRMRPRDDGNGGQRKGPRFNIYWVWAIIFAVLVGFQLFGSLTPDTKGINDLDFYAMMKKGDVDKITTVTNKNLIRVYLKKESVEKYKSQLSKN
ncbi:MAG TPA: ATP-dependent metallopeptidase FtsH/Yme1/Tma family protein, partial [Pseudobacter sp.]|nr:ATP-dependent metallopeptidase FtsH/Yme1/Tma family protein [Pseudobacter sp.]